MTSCRGEVGLNTYPQGPAGEAGTNGGKGICSTEDEISIREENTMSKKVFLAQMQLFVKCCSNTKTEMWKMSGLFCSDDEEI